MVYGELYSCITGKLYPILGISVTGCLAVTCGHLSHYLLHGTTRQIVLDQLFLYSFCGNCEPVRKLHTSEIHLNAT